MSEQPIEKLAYAAGIIDGEGSISIRKAVGSKGERNFRYELLVSVSNTFPQMIRFLSDTFGGSMCREPQRSKPEKWRPVYRWQISGPTAARFLSIIKPYLVCKVNQAELALRFRESFQRNKCCKIGLSQETVHSRHQNYLDMMALHKEVPPCEVLFF